MREREKVEIPRGIGQEVGAALGSGPPSPALASRGQAGAQTLSLPWAQCLQEPHPDAVQAVRAPGLWIQHPGEKDRGQRGGSRGPRAAAGTMDYVEGRLSRPSVGMGGDQEARAEAGLLLWCLPCLGYLFFCLVFKIIRGTWVPCLPLGEWKVGGGGSPVE